MAQRPPRCPRPREGLRDQVLGQRQVAGDTVDGAQALIAPTLIELREVLGGFVHTPHTYEGANPLTRGSTGAADPSNAARTMDGFGYASADSASARRVDREEIR